MILRDSVGTLTEYEFTVSGVVVEEQDTELFRGPYGTDWLAAGSGRTLPGSLRLLIEIPESLDPFGADDPATVIAAVNDAVWIDLPWYSGRVEGVTSASVTPVARGYRLDVDVLLSESIYTPYFLLTEAGETLLTEAGDSIVVRVR